MNPIDRRKFLKVGALAAGTAALLGGQSVRAQGPARLKGQQSVFGLVVPKMDRVRVGFIGVGERGYWHVKLMSNIDGVEVKAIADPHQAVVDRALKELHDKNIALPDTYTDGDYGYRKMLERDDIDLVLIATPWRWHTPMAVEAMHSGKHVFVEVPAATSVEEAWLLVDTAEQTQKNCMMGENVCYGRNELMALNLVRQGLMGDLLHGEAAYIHELRWQMKEVDHKTGSWRTAWHAKRNGNLYPTHGLGPIAQYMNINRGDRFDYMTSISSPSLGRAAYAAREFPADHQRNQLHYINGDMNTSIIKTKLGRSIMVQHDTTTPRPYSRHNLIQGTNGVFAGYPNRIALENNPLPAGEKASYHKWDYEMDKWYEKFDHPLYKRMGIEAERNGGHGGMDFLMFWRMVYCFRNGLPLDQDVYDAASWSVVAPLSTQSVNDQGNSQKFPDFTRGDWQSNTPLGIVT